MGSHEILSRILTAVWAMLVEVDGYIRLNSEKIPKQIIHEQSHDGGLTIRSKPHNLNNITMTKCHVDGP